MGCSQSMEYDVHNPKTFTTNPRQIPEGAHSHQQGSSNFSTTNPLLKSIFSNNSKLQNSNSSYYTQFDNSYDYIWDLYQKCSGNLQQFFNKLQGQVSDIYIKISKQTLEQMNQNALINNESKIQISEQILTFNLNILKVIGKKTNHKFDDSLFKQVNKLQKNLVGYLKMKYPRGAQTFVPGDLMKVFKEFDISQNVQFDILRNSNTYFGDQDDQNLSKSIKIFLNKIIDELDINYLRFQKMMQEDVFCVKDQNNQLKTLNYKIGRKIPQNVNKYIDLDSNNLQINSPQIFRVLIKWMTDLQEVLLTPTEKINTKKNFKCFIQQDQKGNNIFDEVNQDEYYDLINYELIQKIESEKSAYEDNMKILLNDMDRFNFNLIKLLDISVRKQKYVPIKQMQIIKYSNLNAKFISWILAQKLMLVMKKLIKIGKSFYDGKNMITLDLINFKVSDLMRCQVSGNKKEILQVYNNLKKLQIQGQIKIIKIKNRLATSLNDAMIIFAMKNTFLICQIQLLLTDSSQKINQKYKNIQTLNHFFYQLQRSPYGILSQIAVLLAYKDSKVSYEDNINFLPNDIHIQKCQKQHKEKVIQKKVQLKPFICTKCTNYYQKLQNLFIMKQCQLCNIFICGKCLLSGNDALLNHIISKQMSEVIQLKINKTLSLLRNFEKSIRARDILGLFQQPFGRIIQQLGSTQFQVSRLIQYLSHKQKQANKEYLYFVLVKFRTGKAIFKFLKYQSFSKQIVDPFNKKEIYNDKKKMFFTSYDLILFFKQNAKYQKANDIQDSFLYIFTSEAILRNQMKTQSISYLKIEDIKIPIDLIQKEVLNKSNNDWQILKSFPDQTLNDYVSTLPDLQGAKSILKFGDLGLFSKHLNYFKQIDWANQVKQLKLGKNNIDDISVILQFCVNLQKLYVNDNHLLKISFTKPLDQLKILNCSGNKIADLQNIHFIKNINKILAENNEIKRFQKNQFLQLKILNLANNGIQKVQQICNSTIPELQQLNLQNLDVFGTSYQKSPSQLLIFDFPKLKSLICTSQSTKIVIKSTKIQRLYYTRANLSQINIASIQNLKYVDLSQNQLQNISFLFPQNMNNVNNAIQQLNASINLIANVPIIKSKSLKKLNLYQNQITSIENLANSAMSEIQSINLNLNSIQKLCPLHFSNLTTLQLTNNPLSDLNQLQKSTLNSLKELKISQTDTIDKFPTLSLKSLKKLQISYVTFSNIDNLTKCDLPQLQQLCLKSCTFQIFPILNFPNLKNLDLEGCQIKKIKNIQESTLQNLETLNLTSLYITDQQLLNRQIADQVQQQAINSQKIFTCKLNFPKLKFLFLDYSNIQQLNGLQSSKLEKIEQLSIRGLNLSQYPLLNLPNLKKIYADSCSITNFSQLMNSQLINIQQVNLSYNQIEKVSDFSFPKLKNLNLIGNKITQFNQVCQNPSLETLDLSSNQLEVFPVIKGPKIKVLGHLYNKFKEISNLQLCYLPKLQTLQMQNYDFSLIKFPKISMESIKSLDFRFNSIKDVSNLQFCNLPLVEDINFSSNSIQTIPQMKFPNLKYLRLNSNILKDIGNLSSSQMPELQIIQLQTNNIQVLPYLPFPNLIKIFMHQNDVTDVSGFNQSPIKNFLILNICKSQNLKDFPILKNTFEELYVNDTSLTDASIINNYKNLKKVQINRTKIQKVPVFKQKLLVMIQIQGNLITDLTQFATEQYPFVTEFSIKGNPLKKMPKIRMPSLIGGYFNECQFQDVSEFQKSDLPNLDMLSFQNNNIKHISSLPFPNMKSIYLSKNPLQEVVFLTLPQYPKLQMLVFATTNIKKVQILPKMPKLSKVWFNSSQIQNISWLSSSALNVPSLSSIVFLGNNISALPELSNFKGLTIHLTGNPIKDIQGFLKTKNTLLTLKISLVAQGDKQFAQKSQKILKISPQSTVVRY